MGQECRSERWPFVPTVRAVARSSHCRMRVPVRSHRRVTYRGMRSASRRCAVVTHTNRESPRLCWGGGRRLTFFEKTQNFALQCPRCENGHPRGCTRRSMLVVRWAGFTRVGQLPPRWSPASRSSSRPPRIPPQAHPWLPAPQA